MYIHYCSVNKFSGAFKYCIVLFDPDNAIAVVPTLWMTADGKMCYWPKSNATKLARDCVAPNVKTFIPCAVAAVLYETGS